MGGQKKFKMKNTVRMHDTDSMGLLYFARQFRFAHDALEEFTASVGYPFKDVLASWDFAFVIVHAEADYIAPLVVGDKLEVHLSIKDIGESSFTLFYELYKLDDMNLVGTVTTVHVTLDMKTRKKIPIPNKLIKPLEDYVITTRRK